MEEIQNDKVLLVYIMSVKIEGNKFYLLEAEKEKWLYTSEKDAIKSLKKMISENGQLNEKNVSLLEVDTEAEKWQIKEMSWSKIAIELIRSEL